MGVSTIFAVVTLLLVPCAHGQGLDVRQLSASSNNNRPLPPAPTPPAVKAKVQRIAAAPLPTGAPKGTPVVNPAATAAKRVAKPPAAKAATGTQPKNDRYLQSLGKITSFMVKLNSFLELTIGTITKQLTDLTTQMAEVRGSLNDLVTTSTQTTKPINAKPPPVPDLPAYPTPVPKPVLPSSPVRPPAPPPLKPPVARRPVQQQVPQMQPQQQPMQQAMQQPIRQPMQPPMQQPMQRFVQAPYQQQLKSAANKQMRPVPNIAKPAVLMPAPQRRMEYYPRQNEQNLRWPGNNEFHPWWQNWWNKNFQGFYPETQGQQRPQLAKPHIGSSRQQFGSTGSQPNFGSSGSHFGNRGSFGESSPFSVGTSPQFSVGTSPQFNSGPSSQFGNGFSQYGSGSQFGGFGSMNGGMGSMWSQKSREPGETEGKGA